jgi:putative ABC transport system substrate-binding protein
MLGGLLCWSLAAHAQPAMPVIGYLGSGSLDVDSHRVQAFREGLRELGYVEGRNVAIEFRWAQGQNDRLPALAAELVQIHPTLLIAGSGTRSALLLKAATTAVPIVFQVAVDPVEAGLVASLNHPGGNLTGVASMNLEAEAKRLELLHEVVPAASTVAILVNPNSPFAAPIAKAAEVAARMLGVQLHVAQASSESEFEPAFAKMADLRVGAVAISTDSFYLNQPNRLAAATVRHAVPTVSPYREFAVAGGLMSYGTDVADSFRQVGVYAGRILKGEKAAELPVQQAVKITLVINLKTARTLNITFPLTLLGRADEVIE